MRTVIVAGGELAPGDAAHLEDAALVVAADGGADALAAFGRNPDRLVGDLDSVSRHRLDALTRAGIPIARHPADKDASDTELAVETALSAGASHVVILGALGGPRLDHELANLLLLAEPDVARIDARIVRGPVTVRALRGPGRRRLDGRVGDTVTLLPLGGDAIGVTTEALQWSLAGTTLRIGRSRGLSNRVVASEASVAVDSGVLLVIETAASEGMP
jgi:thiamine pyrophosphokinase